MLSNTAIRRWDENLWRGTSGILLLIILLGFGLRMHALERQSMWTDEGLTLYRARLTIADVFRNKIVIDDVVTNDPNPPLYFFLLNLWRQATGESMTAMRMVGALFGVLSIALMYLLTTAVNGRSVGLVAAFLLAISPFHVWQSQVLRNYSLLITFNLMSMYGLSRYLLAADKKRSRLWLILWAITGLLGIYTHYFGAFVFAYSLIPLTVSLIHQWGIRRLFKQKWVWSLLILVVLITIPGISIAYTHFRGGQQIDFFHVPLGAVLQHAVSAFAVGIEPNLFHPWQRYLPALIAAFIGGIIGWYKNRKMTAVMLGYQLIPLGLLLLLSTINPLYNGVRHLLIGLPPFIIFVALGIAAPLLPKKNLTAPRPWFQLQRWGRVVLGLLVIGIQIWWLTVQFTSPRLLRDDIRGAAHYLNQAAAADDIIILHDTIISTVFDYYYDGPAPWQPIPELALQDVEKAKTLMQTAGEQGRRIWFLDEPEPRTGFPREVLKQWAEENWASFYSKKYPWMWLKVNLRGYVADPVVDRLPSQAVPIGTTFRQDLRLDGVDIAPVVYGGEIWPISWYLTSLNPQPGNYTLSLRLIDEQGKVWQQIDEIIWDTFPPIMWKVNEITQYHQFSMIPTGIPPGNYQVMARLLDNNLQTLLVENQQSEVYLGDIEVKSPGTNLENLPPHVPQYTKLGTLSLLGYQLPADGSMRPGHALPLSLLWQTRQTPQENYQVRVELLDENGTIAESTTPLTRDSYPPSQWQENEVLRGFVDLIIPATAVAGTHTIRLTLVDAAGSPASKTVNLDTRILVEQWPLETTLPPIAHPLSVPLGEPPLIQLHGFDLPETMFRSDSTLPLTLIWQAVEVPATNYVVFVHLVGEDENIVAQQDGMPVDGTRPTAGWRANEVLIDQHNLYLSADIEPGTYQLYVGLYDPKTGERLLPELNDDVRNDGRIPLGRITIGDDVP